MRLRARQGSGKHPPRMKLAAFDLANGDRIAGRSGVDHAGDQWRVAAAQQHRLAAAETGGVVRREPDLGQVAEAEAERTQEAVKGRRAARLAGRDQRLERDQRALVEGADRKAAERHDVAAARHEIEAITALEGSADFTPFDAWGIPAKAITQTARLVASARLADAQGDLSAAAAALEQAVVIEEGLAYTEPAYWFYPVRQSLGAVRLRQGRLDEAEKALREPLARVRNNGWALAALAEVYRKRGDTAAERTARQALSKAWFGTEGGPDLTKL